MFISSIRRWRSGLIAAVRMVSSIGRLLLVEGAETLSPHRAALNRRATSARYPFINTPLPSREAGSFFFLGEIYTDLPLPVTRAAREHCGSCHACIDACPTGAIVAPYRLDARRCISYLTIELRGSIPEALRPLIGNRVYGCDDCQLVCPWNKYAQPSPEPDFAVRHGLDAAELVALFGWSESEFKTRTEGSAIRRISYACWLRNLAVGLGNAPYSARTVAALRQRADDPSPLVREHVAWALQEQERRRVAR